MSEKNFELKSLIVLFKASQSLVKNVKESLKDSVLTVNEFTVMEALYTKGELVTQDLADKILIPNSSLTYVLDILEEKRYIKRDRDPKDRRRQLISLTTGGKKIFKGVYDHHYEYMQRIFTVLSNEERKDLEEMLKRVGKKAEEELKYETSHKKG